jgi:hypothetical protein
MGSETNAPIETLRDGRLKATIWENKGESGPYHSVTLAKVYEDRDGKLQETHSFSGSELLRIAELAREAHGYLRGLRRDAALDREPDARPEPVAPSRGDRIREDAVRQDRPARFRGHANPGLER